MAHLQQNESGNTTGDWQIVEQIVERFESNWSENSLSDISEHLPLDERLRPAVLVELVHADLELRLKSGKPTSVESYFQRFQELERDRNASLNLILAEYRFRRRKDVSVSVEEFVARFPGFAEAIRDSTIDANSLEEGRRHFLAQSARVTQLEAGSVLGNLTLLEQVGRGATATVWKAIDTRLGRHVAVKFPRAAAMESVGGSSFLREAQTLARLRHPGIVTLYEVGQAHDVTYIVSEFVDGESLSSLMKAKPPTFREAAAICEKICEALQHSHQAGIVHRDLKPHNVLVDGSGNPKLADFGLAKWLEREDGTTRDGQVLGTPAYMSPEQAMGGANRADALSDIYSLGVILFELLTGEVPFRGAMQSTLHRIVHEEPPSPRKLDPRIPRDLETICLRCLQKVPTQRYLTANAVCDDLRRWRSHEPIIARPISRLQRALRWCRRRPALASLSAGILVVSIVSFVAVTWQWRQAVAARQRTEEALRGATALRLTAESRSVQSTDPTLGVLLAVEAVKMAGNICPVQVRATTDQGLYDALRLIGGSPLVGHQGPVHCARFSPDGKTIYTASEDGEARIWQVDEAGRIGPSQVLSHHDAPVYLLEIGPAGDTLVTAASDGVKATSDGSLQLYKVDDAHTAEEESLISDQVGEHCKVAFDPTGRWFAAINRNNAITLWNLQAKNLRESSQRLTAPRPIVGNLCFARDGNVLLASDETGVMYVWRLGETLLDQPTIANHGNSSPLRAMTCTRNGLGLITIDDSFRATLWSVAEDGVLGELTTFMVLAEEISCLKFDSTGKRLAAIVGESKVCVWSLDNSNSAASERILDQPGPVYAISFSPDGKLIATGGLDAVVRIINLQSERPEVPIEQLRGHSRAISDVQFSPDGQCVLSASHDATARLWTLASTSAIPTVLSRPNSRTDGFVLSPNGRWLVAKSLPMEVDASGTATEALGAGRLNFWDLNQTSARAQPRSIEVDTPTIDSWGVSPDSKWLVTGCGDNTARLWQLASDDPSSNPILLAGHQDRIAGIAISPDSYWLATASYDQSIRIWDLRDPHVGKCDEVVTGLSSRARSVSISPNGKRIIVETADGLVHVWRRESESFDQTETLLRDPSGGAELMICSSSGDRIVTYGLDNFLRIWDLDYSNPDAAPRAFCQASNVKPIWTKDRQGARIITQTENETRVWLLSESAPDPVSIVLKEAGDQILDAAVSSEPRRLVTGHFDGTVRFWQLSGKASSVFPAYVNELAAPILAADWAPDSQWVVTGSHDGKIHRWESENSRLGSVPLTLQDAGQSIKEVNFNLDSRWVFTLGNEGLLQAWPMDRDDIIRSAQGVAGRNLTDQERRQYAEQEETL